MKLLLVFAAFAVAVASATLQEDFDAIRAVIPEDKVVALFMKYKNDPDIVRVDTYLRSSDFTKVINIVNHVKEVRDIVSWIQGKGVDVIGDINKIADIINQPHWPVNARNRRSVGSWQDFAAELKKLVPQDKIMSVVMDRLANSDDFGELFEMISEVDYQKLHDDALSHPEIVDLINRLETRGVDVKKIWEEVKAIFGWA